MIVFLGCTNTNALLPTLIGKVSYMAVEPVNCKRTPNKLLVRGLSPEKNDCFKRAKSTHKRYKRKRQEVEEYDIEEEESQIESSLPSYMEHVFGNCLCFSQEQVTKNTHNAKHAEDNESSTKLSQMTPTENNSKPSTKECAITLSDELLVINNGSSESVVDGPVEGKLSASKELKKSNRVSPPRVASNSGGFSKERWSSGLKRRNIDLYDPNHTKRRHLLASTSGCYRQPPDCMLLKDCSEAEKIVNLLALVVQGKFSMKQWT